LGADRGGGGERGRAGPTAVVLRQTGHWTIGMLATQLWSYAGDRDRTDVNTTLLQPFFAYSATRTVTLTLNSESVASWNAAQHWSVPVHLVGSKIVKLGSHPLSVQLGGGWFAARPDGGPGWRLRSGITLLVPAK
jgi:hypothetical protein